VPDLGVVFGLMDEGGEAEGPPAERGGAAGDGGMRMPLSSMMDHSDDAGYIACNQTALGRVSG
jgi:hypothetical protein